MIILIIKGFDTMKRAVWIYYELRWYVSKLYERRTHMNRAMGAHKYAGKNTLNALQSNQIIYDAIISNVPFFCGRIGGNEMNVIAYSYRYKWFPFRTDARKESLHDLCIGAGFFPEDNMRGEQFVELMTESVKELDIVGVWSRYMEEWLINQFAKESNVAWIHNLEPWNVDITKDDGVRWSYALKDKRVLIIHPFEDTIREQYDKHRMELFKNIDEELLPEFELITIKAVQSMGGGVEGYADWFDAYNQMLEQCRNLDFDVAIIGCGAYGFPLGAEIKKMGKIAIHLGGVTQLLFGIRGRRWDSYGGIYESMINDSWTRPSNREITTIMKEIENGCYC